MRRDEAAMSRIEIYHLVLYGLDQLLLPLAQKAEAEFVTKGITHLIGTYCLCRLS